jgi:small subunit ribosomal protein S5
MKEETQNQEKENKEEAKKEEVLEKQEKEVSKVNTILDKWVPKTALGKKVKVGEIKTIDDALLSGHKILESEIVDVLIPDLEYELLNVGQSKGKFGGGKRSIWKTTQKKTKEGNKPKFATGVIVGNKDGYIGFSYGKSKENVLAREKAIRKAKISIMKIRRGCGSWECGCKEPHSIPLQVTGKCSSIELVLKPAPKGTGLVAQEEVKKILTLAGIKDIYTKKRGKSQTSLNLIRACIDALKKLNKIKIDDSLAKQLGMIEGKK